MSRINPGELISPTQAMHMAIETGWAGVGFVAPNPLVGCVIVDRDHRLLAVGSHRQVGGDHAEVDALKQIEDRGKLVGSHVYVTLEPCAHQGRTPSCAKTLAPLRIGSLTYAVEDPNPLVSGKGAGILRASGTETLALMERNDIPLRERQELVAAAEELAEVFLHNMRAREPFVAVKVATSLDGKMAMTSGESKWITGDRSRQHGHLLRARYDAVAIGRKTFVADNPYLNVRHSDFPAFRNRAIVLDPKGKTLEAMERSNILQVRAPEDVLVFVGAGEPIRNPCGVRVLEAPRQAESSFFVVSELLKALKAEGLTSVLVEGGARTFASFFAAGKVQRLHLFQAPFLLGGKNGLSWTQHMGGETISDRIELLHVRRAEFGSDLYWTGRTVFTSAVR